MAKEIDLMRFDEYPKYAKMEKMFRSILDKAAS